MISPAHSGRTQWSRACSVAAAAALAVSAAVALVTVLSIADAGRRGWEEVPRWFWALTVAAFAVVWYAIADGRKAYRHEPRFPRS